MVVQVHKGLSLLKTINMYFSHPKTNSENSILGASILGLVCYKVFKMQRFYKAVIL